MLIQSSRKQKSRINLLISICRIRFICVNNLERVLLHERPLIYRIRDTISLSQTLIVISLYVVYVSITLCRIHRYKKSLCKSKDLFRGSWLKPVLFIAPLKIWGNVFFNHNVYKNRVGTWYLPKKWVSFVNAFEVWNNETMILMINQWDKIHSHCQGYWCHYGIDEYLL